MQRYKVRARTLLIAALAGALSTAGALPAQERPSNPLPNTVWVGADGKFESDPDTALVQFGISAQEKQLQDASQKASQQAHNDGSDCR